MGTVTFTKGSKTYSFTSNVAKVNNNTKDAASNIIWDKEITFSKNGNSHNLPLTISSKYASNTNIKFTHGGTNYYIATWWYPTQVDCRVSSETVPSGQGSYYKNNGKIGVIYFVLIGNTYVSYNKKTPTVTLSHTIDNGYKVSKYSNNKVAENTHGYTTDTIKGIAQHTTSGGEKINGTAKATWTWNGSTYTREESIVWSVAAEQ